MRKTTMVRFIGILGITLFSLLVVAPVTAQASGESTQVNGYFSGVTCTGGLNCLAVGSYHQGFSYESSIPLTEERGGAAWSIVPANAHHGVLNAVTCAGPSHCMAVGNHVNSSGTGQSLTERWTGSGWKVVPSPSPAGATGTLLSSVACSSGSNCMAVGEYFTACHCVPSNSYPVAEHWNGSQWSLMSVPIPFGTIKSELTGVACPTANNCLAVGWYRHNNAVGQESPITETWDGSTWQLRHGAGGQISPAVSFTCASPSNCTLVSGAGLTALAELWNGTNWTNGAVPSWASAPVQVPVHSADGVYVSSVSCISSTSCVAVGTYSTGSGYEGYEAHTLGEHWDGNTWTLEATPPLPGQA